MKSARHAIILDIIEHFDIDTQEELAARLREKGVPQELWDAALEELPEVPFSRGSSLPTRVDSPRVLPAASCS